MLQTYNESETLFIEKPDAGDETLYVNFYMKPVLNRLKTDGGTTVIDGKEVKVEPAGHPVYDDKEYVTIRGGGDKTLINDRPVNRNDKRRFAKRYEAFKRGVQGGQSGMPLRDWPSITRSQAEELAYFGVVTVEQLATLPDGNIPSIGPVSALKQAATKWLEQAKGNAPLVKMQTELAARDEQIAALKAQMQDVLSRMVAQPQVATEEKKKPAKQ